MSRKRKFIPVEEAFTEWRKDPKYVAAYDALEEEFAPASATGSAHAALIRRPQSSETGK